MSSFATFNLTIFLSQPRCAPGLLSPRSSLGHSASHPSSLLFHCWLPLPLGKLPEPGNAGAREQARKDASAVFTRPPVSPGALPPEPCPQLRKASRKRPRYHSSGWGLGAGGPLRPAPALPRARAYWRGRCAVVLRQRRPGSGSLRTAPRSRPQLCPLGDEGLGWALRGAAGVPRPSASRLRGKL